MTDGCFKCGAQRELRLGCCFDCATAGEERAAKRSAIQHFVKCLRNISQANWTSARYDIVWCWERLTSTGDYTPGGYFDQSYPGFRG